MFYHLLYPLHSIVPGFNVFRYLTFRTAYAILTGLMISLILRHGSSGNSVAIKSARRSERMGPNRTNIRPAPPLWEGC